MIGCGGGAVDNIPIKNNPQSIVTLSGYIIEGTQSPARTSSELRYSLGNNLSGINVFLENNNTLRGITDNNGKFIIENVPEGYHSIIAEKKEAGAIIYRQRLRNINIKGIDNYYELPEPISILPSPYLLTLLITNTKNQPIKNAKIFLWGRDYFSDSDGLVSLTDFPNLSDEEATISASGYKTTKIKLSFGETLNSKIFVKLSQTSDNNSAPIVEIKHDSNSSIIKENNKLYISANKQLLLTALGNDPDGNSNKISWNWSADKGSFSGLTTANTLTYTSPSTSGEATITLIGKDEKGLESKAELKLIVIGGSKTDTSTDTQTNTETNTSTNTHTETNTDTSTSTNTQTQTDTNTSTNTQSATNTEINTQTNTDTGTQTDTENIATFTVVFPKKTSDKLIINFNKPLLTSDFLNNVGFLPIATQTWSFSNNNKTASFIPEKGSWYPGSYNLLVINKDLKFNDGSVLKDDYMQAFTLNSDIPVPEGYRSYAFPAEVAANETFVSVVPGLDSNKYSYAMVISKSDDNNALVLSPGEINERIKIDPTYQYRLEEKELLKLPVPDYMKYGKNTSFNRASLAPHSIGETRYFYIKAGGIGSKVYSPSTLVTMSDKVLVYVLNNCLNENSINKALNILSSVERITEIDRDYFGDEPPFGLDYEERLSIVLYEYEHDQNGGVVYGYFSPNDLFTNNNNHNGCKAVYLAYNVENDTLLGTLAHEFQHMIYLYNKVMNETNYDSDIWLNEGLSVFAEEVCGFGFNKDKIIVRQILDSMNNFKNDSLTFWNNGSSYGNSYLFIRYLVQAGRYKNTSKEMTRALVQNGYTGEDSVEYATKEPFENTLAKFGLSLFINDYGNPDTKAYGIHGINLKGTYFDVTLPGYEIEDMEDNPFENNYCIPFANMKRNTIRCFRKKANSKNQAAFIYMGNNPVSIYCFDERK